MTELMQAWNDPQMRHAMMVHAPITLSLLGLLVAIANAALGWKLASLRWVACITLILFAFSAKAAESSGQFAETETGALSEAAMELLHEHEEHALNMYLLAAGAAILVGLSAIKQKWVRHGSAWLAVLLAGFAVMRIGAAAHHGGELVYAHAVGTGGGAGDSAADPRAATSGGSSDDTTVDPRLAHFREQVFPILHENCLKCHNPVRLKGKLDQTTMAGILAGGGSGDPALVPGDPDGSLMIELIKLPVEDDLCMPPDEQLSADQIEALEQWVRDGAVWVDIATLEEPASSEEEAAPVEERAG